MRIPKPKCTSCGADPITVSLPRIYAHDDGRFATQRVQCRDCGWRVLVYAQGVDADTVAKLVAAVKRHVKGGKS